MLREKLEKWKEVDEKIRGYWKRRESKSETSIANCPAKNVQLRPVTRPIVVQMFPLYRSIHFFSPFFHDHKKRHRIMLNSWRFSLIPGLPWAHGQFPVDYRQGEAHFPGVCWVFSDITMKLSSNLEHSIILSQSNSYLGPGISARRWPEQVVGFALKLKFH